MAVKLRRKRFGRKNRAYFRLNAIDARTPRDGRVIEELGLYDPIEKDAAKAIRLNRERIEYWLGVGAVPTETVVRMLVNNGIPVKKKK